MNNQELHASILAGARSGEIIDAELSSRKEAYTMVYHFVRVEAADIRVSGVSEGQCLDKALLERQKQCRPSSVKGEIVE